MPGLRFLIRSVKSALPAVKLSVIYWLKSPPLPFPMCLFLSVQVLYTRTARAEGRAAGSGRRTTRDARPALTASFPVSA